MTDSINFIEHTEEGTLVELRGNIHIVDGKACARISDLKQILRIYNGMYKGRRQAVKASGFEPVIAGSNPAAPSTPGTPEHLPDNIKEALECAA